MHHATILQTAMVGTVCRTGEILQENRELL